MDKSKYQCDICKYCTNKKSNYENHLARKNPCKPINVSEISPSQINICLLCNDNFKSKRSLAGHLRFCVKGAIQECSKCHVKFLHRQSKYNHLKANSCIAVDQLSIIKKTETVVGNTVINQQNIACTSTSTSNNNNNTFNIKIVGLGKEDVSYFTDTANVPALVASILERQADGLCDLIALKHFNPDHPENQNVKKLLKKDDVMQYHDGNKWQKREAKVVTKSILSGIIKNLTHMIDTLHVHNEVVPTNEANIFMDSIGEALDIDFTGDNYDYVYEKDDDLKKKIAEQIMCYTKDFIYNKTKEFCLSDIVPQ
jgi:hypothetical protein